MIEQLKSITINSIREYIPSRFECAVYVLDIKAKFGITGNVSIGRKFKSKHSCPVAAGIKKPLNTLATVFTDVVIFETFLS